MPSGVAEDRTRILISGASGMLGTAIRQALAAREAQILQLVRGTSAEEGQLAWDPVAKPPVGDARPLEGCIAAIHLSGASVAGHRWTPAYREELFASRVGSTRALAHLLAGLRCPPRVLLVASAVGIYGDRGEELLEETSSPGNGFLAVLCREWEAAALPAVEAGIRVVHLRFGVVLAPGGGALARMLPIFRLGLGGNLGNGRQWMSWVGVEDVTGAMLFALETPALAGPVNVTAPRPVRNAEFTRELARQLRRPAVLPAPAFALRLAFGTMADEALLASARAIPSKLLTAGYQFKQPTVEVALAASIG